MQSDCDRLKQLLERVDFMPLGSGAIAGNPFEIDRQKLANLLGFKSITRNSMNAVSDRDFVGKILSIEMKIFSNNYFISFQLNSISFQL